VSFPCLHPLVLASKSETEDEKDLALRGTVIEISLQNDPWLRCSPDRRTFHLAMSAMRVCLVGRLLVSGRPYLSALLRTARSGWHRAQRRRVASRAGVAHVSQATSRQLSKLDIILLMPLHSSVVFPDRVPKVFRRTPTSFLFLLYLIQFLTDVFWNQSLGTTDLLNTKYKRTKILSLKVVVLWESNILRDIILIVSRWGIYCTMFIIWTFAYLEDTPKTERKWRKIFLLLVGDSLK